MKKNNYKCSNESTDNKYIQCACIHPSRQFSPNPLISDCIWSRVNYAAVATSGNLNASTAAESTSTTNRQISSVDIYTANASSGSLLARDDISVVIFR